MGYQLPPELVQKLLDAERGLNEGLEQAQKAEECGIDCQSLRADIQAKIEQSVKIRKEFGPQSI